ncbi:MAG: fibronectin type III domain-containing protein [Saprospiraceae bacterium]|nr:fibronectin type III domain-containing protein [Saprospiraceae bacterium]
MKNWTLITQAVSGYLILGMLLAANLLSAQCEDADASIWLDTWASCQPSLNPKAEYGNSHWIQYDFGSVRNLSKTWVWNTNDPNKLQQGFQQVKVDYSVSGEEWTYWGEMTFPMGIGQAVYGGFSGPDLVGIQAQYVLLTALSNYGDAACFGLAEIKFNLLPNQSLDSIPSRGDDCAAIEEVYVEAVTESEAFLSWDYELEGDEAFFVVEYRTGEGEWMEAETDEAEILLIDLEPDTDYEFRVAIICEEEAFYSEVEDFTTGEQDPDCFRVEGIMVSEITGNSAQVSWPGGDDFDLFFFRYTKADELDIEMDETEEDNVLLEELEPYTDYILQVGVICGEEIAWSASVYFTTTGTTATGDPNSPIANYKVFPNPTNANIVLEFNTLEQEPLIYYLSNTMGSTILQGQYRSQVGTNRHTFNLSNFPDGVYILAMKTKDGRQRMTERIVKIGQ